METVAHNDVVSVGIGLSTERDAAQAIKEALHQARSALSKDNISLAIVFSTIDFAHLNVISTITNLLGETPIIGCTAAAIISDKGISTRGLAVMLMSLPKSIFMNTAFVQDVQAKTALGAGEQLGEKLLRDFHGMRRDLGIFFSDGMTREGWNTLTGLQEKLGTSFPLIGAFASDNLRFSRSFIYSNNLVTGNACCGMLLGGRLNFGWGIKHGWKPLGKIHHVTKATANIVYEIDGLPARKIYEDYLASDQDEFKKELRRISVFYPMGIRLDNSQEYLLRNIKSVEDDGSLVFHGNVPEDSAIRLMIGTKESCLEATQQAVQEAKIGYISKPAVALIFNSVSRYILLGRDAEKEIRLIKEGMGKDTPILGIYTYGEQAPLKISDYHNKTYFHNQTITVLAIGG